MIPAEMATSDVVDHREIYEGQVATMADGDESKETIHSGHFMVTKVHEENENRKIKEKGYDFSTVKKETLKSYRFGAADAVPIDASLSKLFECLTLAFSGKVVSPKWKQFKGMRLTTKEKIRLNNIIWRAWHLQFIKGNKPPIIQFALPFSEDKEFINSTPQAVVLEGKYWKHTLQTVISEYQKWREYFRKTYKQRHKGPEHFDLHTFDQHESLVATEKNRESEFGHSLTPVTADSTAAAYPTSPSPMILDEADFFNEFSDTLFSSLNQNQPCAFPNPREIAHSAFNADIIQPGLVQLQPNLMDDVMDSLEIDLFSGRGSSHLGSVNFAASHFIFTGNQDSSMSEIQQQQASLIFQDAANNSQVMDPNLQQYSQPITDINSRTNIPAQSLLQQQQPAVTVLKPATFTIPAANLNFISEQPQQAQLQQESNNFPRVVTEQSIMSVDKSSAIDLLKQQHQQQQQQQQQQHMHTNYGAQLTNIDQTHLVSPTTQNVNYFSPTNVMQPVTTTNRPNNIASVSSVLEMLQSNQENSQGFELGASLPQPKTLPAKIDHAHSQSKPQYSSIAPAPAPTPPTTTTTSSTIIAHLLQKSPASTMGASVTSAILIPPIKTEKTISQKSPPDCATPSLLSAPLSPRTLITPSDPTELSLLLGSGTNHSPPIGRDSPLSTSITTPISPVNNSSGSLVSPVGSPSNMFKEEDGGKQDSKKSSHISAEQKRRVNIKSGFDSLQTLIPSLNQNQNTKISKAAMLQKAVEYTIKMQREKNQMQKEVELLKQEIENLNAAISDTQSQLPATGVPVTKQRYDQMQEMFDEYVRLRTGQNWKFWIFSIIFRPLFESYNNLVSTASSKELCRTVLTWMDQHCALTALRPGVLTSLRQLSRTTSILSDPTQVPQQAAQAVSKKKTDH